MWAEWLVAYINTFPDWVWKKNLHLGFSVMMPSQDGTDLLHTDISYTFQNLKKSKKM